MNVKQITKTTMTRTLTTIVGSLFVLLLAAAPALAQTGTLQGKALYLYDGGSAANLNRIGLFTPADADLTTTYNLLLPKTQGAQNDILYVESTLGPVTTLQFTNGNGLFWRLLGNTSTTPWNGTSGNFLGTADAQNLVIRAGGANTIEFWNGTASANRWTIPAAGGLTQGADNSQVTFTGNVDATNGLDVTGANLTVGGANFTVAPGTGNTHTSGELDVDGNTTIGDAATDSHTILGVTTINGGTSTAATTIGNAAGGHVTLAVNPGTTNLVFNGIVQAVPTGTDDLLWIQSAGNEVRRTNIGGLVDEGLQYDNGKIRLGANAVDVNPIVSSRTATIGTGGTLTFSTTGGSNTMLVLNNNGNVGISTVGTGTTTIGNGSAGAISVTGGSTIGLTAGSTATVTAGSGNIDLNATTLDVNITAGTNVDVASATTNINTGTGNVNIGNAGGTNTILGTTDADGNTTINDGVNAFTTNIGTGGNTGAVTVGNTGNTVSILGGTNTITGTTNTVTGTTNINTTGSATTTIGNTTSGGAVGIAANANITVDPGATSNNLVLNNILNLAPITDLLWIDASNNVRRASFTTTANEGVDFDNGAYRLGSLTANTGKPIVNPRFVNVGTGGTLTFTTATVGDQMLVLNNNGNVGISTAGSGTTTIGSAAAGAISAQSVSTIGLTAGTTFDVASATTNINTLSGNVNIGNGSGTNTILGTTNAVTGTTNINTTGNAATQIGNGIGANGNVGIGEAAIASRLLSINGTAQTGIVATPNVRIDHLGGAAITNAYTNDANNGILTADGNGDMTKWDEATLIGSVAWLRTGNTISDANNILGTLNNVNVDVRAYNQPRIRLAATVNNTTPAVEINTDAAINASSLIVNHSAANTTASTLIITGNQSTGLGVGRVLGFYDQTPGPSVYANGLFYSDGSYGMGPGGAGNRDIFFYRDAASSFTLSANRTTGGAGSAATFRVAGVAADHLLASSAQFTANATNVDITGATSTEINTAGSGTVTIGNASSTVSVLGGTNTVTGTTNINTTGNAATTIGSLTNTSGVAVRANNDITIDVAATSNDLVLNKIATTTTPVNMLSLDGSGNVRQTAFSGTADEGLMWDGTTGDYKLGHTSDGSNPITTVRYVRLTSPGELTFNDGTNTLFNLATGVVNIGSTGTTNTILGTTNADGNTTINDNAGAFTTNIGTTGTTGAVTVGNASNTVSILGGTNTVTGTTNTVTGTTNINTGGSAATTIGNATGGQVTLAVNPGTTNLVFNGIVQAVPTGTDHLLWIQSSAGNEVRRTNIGGLVDEGLQYDNGKIRLGANAVDVNPIVSSRTATIGTGGTLTFSTTGGSNTMLVLNNNGNVGISTVGAGTTTIGNGSAGAISVTGGSTIGLTAGTTFDVTSATTNINTGAGNVNIGNAGGTNTILGTTNADGNTTINDGVNAFTTNIGTGGNTGAVTVGNAGNTVSILGGTNTITGTTNTVTGTTIINTTGSATTTIGNTTSGGAVGIAANADITIDPGATSNDLVLNNIQVLAPVQDLLWIDASNNVRRASFTATADEGTSFSSGAYRMGSLVAGSGPGGNPIVSNRFVNVGSGGTLSFTTAAGTDRMLVLNNNGNVEISTVGAGTTTIGSATAGAISAQSASTIGLTAGTDATITAANNVNLTATTQDVNITSTVANVDVASATTNINTGTGNVNIGNGSGTNTVLGTTNINATGTAATTIGNASAGAFKAQSNTTVDVLAGTNLNVSATNTATYTAPTTNISSTTTNISSTATNINTVGGSVNIGNAASTNTMVGTTNAITATTNTIGGNTNINTAGSGATNIGNTTVGGGVIIQGNGVNGLRLLGNGSAGGDNSIVIDPGQIGGTPYDVVMNNIASSASGTTVLTLTGANEVRQTSLNGVAWLLGGNTVADNNQTIGTNSNHDFNIETNGITRWTVPAAGGLTQGADNSQVTFTGNVDATNGLDVTTADLTVGGSNFTVAPGTGNTTIAGTLGVTGLSTLGATTVVGAANINASGTAVTNVGTGSTGAVTIGNSANTVALAGGTNTVTGAANINTTGGSITTIGHNGGGAGNVNINAFAVNVPNLPAGAFGENVVTSNAGALRTASITTILGGTPWLNGGNSFGAAGTLGTNDAFDLNIETNGTTRWTVPAAGGLTQGTAAQVTFTGNVDATNGLDVTTADLTVGGANFTVAPGTGNTTIAGTLGVTGLSTLGATTVVGAANINASGTAVTNVGTGSTGAVTIGNSANTVALAGGTNTITGTANINTTGGSNTTIGHNGGGAGSVNINAVAVNAPNLPAGAVGDNVVTSNAGALRTASITTILGGTPWLNGGNSFGAAGTLGTNDAYDLNIETGGITRWTVPAAGGLTQGTAAQVTFTGNVDATNGLDVTTADLTVGGSNFTVAPGTGNTTIAGTLGVTGLSTLGATTVVGAANINASGTAVTNVGTGSTGAVTIGNSANTVSMGAVTTFGRAVNVQVQTVTANVTLTDADYVVICNNTADITVTLPAAAAGRMLVIKSANTNNVTIDPPGAVTVDGVATITIAGGGNTSRTLVSDGTNWFVIGN